ncbi:MAG TPA: molecular chaperone DnaJ [Tissierellia bacterium]|nr:molecular chaperone DnaJ [Tissierellia bacterium]
MAKRDYYEVLGLERSADEKAIKSAFRKQAMKYHPDKNPGDKEAEAKFKEVNEAYEILSHPEKKARYDQFGHAGVDPSAAGPTGPGFEGFDPFSGFGDIFSEFFGGAQAGGGFTGGGGSYRRVRPGADVDVEVKLSFMEAVKGTSKEFTFYRLDTCPTCDGSGAKPGTSTATCSTCQGSGQVRYSQRTLFGEAVSVAECSTCHGSGQVPQEPCETCNGKGKVRRKKTLKVNVPAGVDTGNVLTVQGEGDIGEPGAPKGDVRVHFRVEPHKTFRREGPHIHQEVHVTFPQATLGDEVELETLDGRIKFKIAPGTQSGTVRKITGGGITNLHGYGKGDHYITIIVDTPTKFTEKQRDLLIELSKTMGDADAKDNRTFFDKVKDVIS